MLEQHGGYWSKIEGLLNKPSEEIQIQEDIVEIPEVTREIDPKAVETILQIYEAIKTNSPEICGAPVSRIKNDGWSDLRFGYHESQGNIPEKRHVVLEWGIWTPNEEIVRLDELWKEYVVGNRKWEEIPDEIKQDTVLADLTFIKTIVRYDELAVCLPNYNTEESFADPYEHALDEVFQISEVVDNPNIILPSIAKSLKDPFKYSAIRSGYSKRLYDIGLKLP